MRFNSIFFESTHGEVIDSNGPNFSIDEPGRRFFGDINKIFIKSARSPAPGRVAGFKQDALALAQGIFGQLAWFDRFGVGDGNDAGAADSGLGGQSLEG